MNKLLSNDFTLTERELKILSAQPPKQTEIYIMKKFISEYKFMKACNNGEGNKTDCWRKLNEVLDSKGYKRKKHVSSVTKLWEEPFVSYEFDNDYYGTV